MKKIILMGLSISVFLSAELSVSDIQNMIIKIHKKRSGIKLKTLDTTKEPFVRLESKENVTVVVIPDKKKRVNKDVRLILHSILNGKAYINDAWMAVDKSILGYKLLFIGKRGVVLRNENSIKKLFLRKKEKNSLIQLEER